MLTTFYWYDIDKYIMIDLKLTLKEYYYYRNHLGKTIKVLNYRAILSNTNLHNNIIIATKWMDKNTKLKDRVLVIINNIKEYPKCKKCSNIVKSTRDSLFLQYCSTKCSSNSEQTRLKYKNTCLEKYGVENSAQSIIARNKISKTQKKCAESKILKIKKTCLEKYGVENYMQTTEGFIKSFKKSLKGKEFEFPSGKKVNLQGYEDIALKELLNTYNEDDLIVETKQINKIIGQIWYITNKKHRYFPDIYIKSINKIIEVKSEYTYKKDINKINSIKMYLKDTNIKMDIYVYNKKMELKIISLV